MKWFTLFFLALPISLINLKRLFDGNNNLYQVGSKSSPLIIRFWLILEILLSLLLFASIDQEIFVVALVTNWLFYISVVFRLYRLGLPWPLFVFHGYVIALLLLITIFKI